MVCSAYRSSSSSSLNNILNSTCDPRVRFDDPLQFYSIDNVQANDYMNIEEREDALQRCWDLYQLNLEVDPEGRSEFWRSDWNELAEEIKRNERVLGVLRSNVDEPVILDESFDSDPDFQLATRDETIFEILQLIVQLLCWSLFFFFIILFDSFFHYRTF